jgi:hypothetical protein
MPRRRKRRRRAAADRREVLRVLLTCDVEVWPRSMDLRHDEPRGLWERDVLGRTPAGDFGVGWQMDMLERHGLKGVFFLETLHADRLGFDGLAEAATQMRARGHDVQLHVHPEWDAAAGGDGDLTRCLWELPGDLQADLIARGRQNLRRAGGGEPCAFRAGSYGANFDTLAALRQLGIAFDSSYNPALLGTHCRLFTETPWLQPVACEGVVELPISCIAEPGGRLRHAQLAACSSRELARGLSHAADAGWHSFVVVLHSFELIRRAGRGPARPDAIMLRRFADLCRFLADAPHRFRTVGFSELDPAAVPVDIKAQVCAASWLERAWRCSEQLRRRWV